MFFIAIFMAVECVGIVKDKEDENLLLKFAVLHIVFAAIFLGVLVVFHDFVPFEDFCLEGDLVLGGVGYYMELIKVPRWASFLLIVGLPAIRLIVGIITYLWLKATK